MLAFPGRSQRRQVPKWEWLAESAQWPDGSAFRSNTPELRRARHQGPASSGPWCHSHCQSLVQTVIVNPYESAILRHLSRCFIVVICHSYGSENRGAGSSQGGLLV